MSQQLFNNELMQMFNSPAAGSLPLPRMIGELTRETTPEDAMNFSEIKQQMDELETHIDTHFRTSAKNNSNMTNAYSLMVGEMDRVKDELKNIHRKTTEEIEALKQMTLKQMNLRAEEIDTLKHAINVLKLDVKKLFDMEWNSKKEQQKVHEEMKYQLHQMNVSAALTISNLISPLTERMKSLELKMHNFEVETTAQINTANKQNIDLISENRQSIDEMQMDMAMSTLNSKRMIDEMEMDTAMKMASLEEIEADMKMENTSTSDSIKNLDKRIEIIAFALSTMDNHDVFTDAVNALNHEPKLGSGPPAKAFPQTPPAKAFPQTPPAKAFPQTPPAKAFPQTAPAQTTPAKATPPAGRPTIPPLIAGRLTIPPLMVPPVTPFTRALNELTAQRTALHKALNLEMRGTAADAETVTAMHKAFPTQNPTQNEPEPEQTGNSRRARLENKRLH